MIKYVPEDTSIVFSEIPDEITLAINISNCPGSCPGCHSPYLQQDTGEELTAEILSDLVQKNPGITCVAFMGEGKDSESLLSLASHIRSLGLKVALYSGRYEVPVEYNTYFDFIKIGPYIEHLGPLNKTTTNQALYEIRDGERFDITYKFWRGLGGAAKFELSDDLGHVKKIRESLKKIKEVYGERYCPCNLERSSDTICPCKDYRETGKCRCKLYKR